MNFQERLNYIRKKRGISAKYIADCLCMGVRNYRKYESGDASPPIVNLVIIADILDVSIDYLLGRDEYLHRHGISFDDT